MQEMKTERVPVMFEPSVLREIDNYRFENRIGSRSMAVRKLIEAALETETKKAAEPRA
jgi:metal-responsive CopG/Arc/MetJ family transcriptional regulator